MTITITNQPVVLKHAAAAFGIAGTAALAAKAVARIAQNQHQGSEATTALTTKIFDAASATSSGSAHIAAALGFVLARTYFASPDPLHPIERMEGPMVGPIMEYLDNASHLTLWRGFPGNPDVQRGARNAVTHLRLRQIAQLQNMLLTGLLHCIPIAGEALDMAKLAAATTIGIKGVSLLLDSTLSLSILDSDIATAAAMISFTTSMCSLHRFRDYDIKKSLKLVAIITIWGACLGKGKAGLAQGGLIGLAGLMGAAVRERLEYNIDEQRLLTIGYLTLGQITTALALALIFVTKPEKSGTWTHQRQNMLKLAKDLSRSAAIGGVVSLINNTCPTRFFSRDAFKRETPGVILLGMLLAHIIKF